MSFEGFLKGREIVRASEILVVGSIRGGSKVECAGDFSTC